MLGISALSVFGDIELTINKKKECIPVPWPRRSNVSSSKVMVSRMAWYFGAYASDVLFVPKNGPQRKKRHDMQPQPRFALRLRHAVGLVLHFISLRSAPSDPSAWQPEVGGRGNLVPRVPAGLLALLGVGDSLVVSHGGGLVVSDGGGPVLGFCGGLVVSHGGGLIVGDGGGGAPLLPFVAAGLDLAGGGEGGEGEDEELHV